MPLNTELLDEQGKTVKVPWSWGDRMTLAEYVLLDGGTVGEADSWDKRGLLNMGYFGAGCDHTFAEDRSYCMVEPGSKSHQTVIEVRKGMRYREFRS